MHRPLALLALVLCTSFACSTDDVPADDDHPLNFPPLECEAVTCAEGSICVQPSEYCDYDLTPPDWVQPASECAPPPASCADLDEPELSVCLWETLCKSLGEYEPAFGPLLAEGLLDCPIDGLDCFE